MNDIYTFDRLTSEYDHISIPKIQRDYAHGRNTEKAIDVRKNLLNDIFSPDKTMSFDFIFGTAKRIRHYFARKIKSTFKERLMPLS